ncbi:hypothetical protein NA56DRAFT_698246 [Hyaloscypha hepaticicola]|uniref:Uncharacterized protein n=1 Tax=Hyaloscypha hepaticicola TaxID=2082293 RepID=A0A2J6QIJ5_9HELO|nr:hypothetical protein NA56DRAFT_698246 [Hyaloscypha hepaticicola]
MTIIACIPLFKHNELGQSIKISFSKPFIWLIVPAWEDYPTRIKAIDTSILSIPLSSTDSLDYYDRPMTIDLASSPIRSIIDWRIIHIYGATESDIDSTLVTQRANLAVHAGRRGEIYNDNGSLFALGRVDSVDGNIDVVSLESRLIKATCALYIAMAISLCEGNLAAIIFV